MTAQLPPIDRAQLVATRRDLHQHPELGFEERRTGTLVAERLTALGYRVTTGVGRKTANVVLGTWFGKNEGIVVDTHVHRLTTLLGLTRETAPEKIEQDLMELVPRDKWTWFSHTLILHGRRVCIARRPKCAECVVNRWCPSSRV